MITMITLVLLGTAVFMFSIASLAVMLATLAPTMPQYSQRPLQKIAGYDSLHIRLLRI
ncbi:hypothetical protein [Neisseria dentiae]|uniref:hypothetical protein n=1 Tax=Neisseria dentiae TaxID=194197 RepID=UPI00211BE305|nr:hypothetical protein [Neisseria dentiae]MCQ9326486.1 hypothetical protein [Neisseria dentiae]